MQAPKRHDIRDVASAAGVSVTTVSHVLNDKGRIASATRERVQRIAAELEYRPSRTARNLVNQRTGLLGLAVSSGSWETMHRGTLHYFTHLMMGATKAAFESGYALASVPIEMDMRNDIPVDGVIVVDPVASDPLLSRLREQGICYVTTGRDFADVEANAWVDNDHIYGTRLALEHLAENGASRIALLSPANKISFTHDVARTYREWCAERGMDASVLYSEDESMERAGYNLASDLLSLDSPPDAIFATYSPLAFGAATAAKAENFEIPEDLMIVMTSTDGVIRGAPTPQITSLDLYPEHLGSEAAKMLIARIEEKPCNLPYLIQPELILGASTGRAQDPLRVGHREPSLPVPSDPPRQSP